MGSTQQQHRLQTGLFSAKMSVAKWRPRSSGKFLRKEVKKRTFAFRKTKSQFRGILKFLLILGVIVCLSHTQVIHLRGTMTSGGWNCYTMVNSRLFAQFSLKTVLP